MSVPDVPAPNVSLFTPAQIPPSGTALNPQPDGKPVPKLFQPIKIRGVDFHNRIFVSPMCQYSAEDGRVTAWPMAHLGGILSRGPGLTLVEATAVLPQGRITPECLGIWSDEHVPPLREIVELAHSQGVKIALQLAGRKASTTVKLSGILAAHGVDLLDVSTGGLHPSQRIVRDDGSIEDIPTLSYQAPFSAAVKKVNSTATTAGLFVGAVGEIRTGPIAEEVLEKEMNDVVFVARQFQRDPASVLTFAEQLGVRVKLAHQIGWGLGYGSMGAADE